MNIANLLSISQYIVDFSVEGIPSVELKWIGYAIKWIFDLFSGMPGAIALGAVVFTLALKTLVLPLDIYSRVKMKKQALLMESMRPEMEKLQKQYANDKNMYQQKVMELQKANGYNPLGACLPTLISLAIFITVFSSFSQYSQYANLSSYNNMTVAYSQAVYEYVLTENTDDETNDKYFLIAAIEDGKGIATTAENAPRVTRDEEDNLIAVDKNGNPVEIYGYYINYDKFSAYYDTIKDTLPDSWKENGRGWAEKDFATLAENERYDMVKDFIKLRARAEAAAYYRAHSAETSFPASTWWVGNVWYPDSMFNKEVPNFSDFRSAIIRAAGSVDSNYEDSYNEVTFDLQKEKNTYNGYFVLIVLAIGFMFLQQFVTMRSQKATSELSSVDGQGAMTNKMMMVIMPIMFGIFSFMYSAAFSIYMITNTVYSLVSTLIINKIVSVRFDKDSEKKIKLKEAGRANRKRLK